MKISWLSLAAAAATLGGCTLDEMERPDAPPGAMEDAVLSGIAPGIYKGDFAIAGVVGPFERGAEWRRGGFGRSKEGGAHFVARGPGVDGVVAGDCRFDAGDGRSKNDAYGQGRLRYRCQFERNGREIDAHLELQEERGFHDERSGYLFYRGERIEIRSTHDSAVAGQPSSSPRGYTMSVNGQDIGGVDLTSDHKRVYLPRDPAYREAAIVGSVALALFLDPDTQSDFGGYRN